MQKKLIALAVAGLMSAPAFAQSNVTIYGVVDFGYKWTGDSALSGYDSRSAIDSGISAGNRLGFKGTEDLGNGLKASFVYETGIVGDRSGSNGLWGGAGSRQSYIALSGNFGTVALGRQYTPAHALLAGNIDPFGFGKGTVASLANVYISPARLDNLAAYVSPTFGGFSVVAAYTNQYSGDETSGNGFGNDEDAWTDARAWAIAPTYKNGPVYVALNVHQIRGNAAEASGQNVVGTVKAWDLGGTYDFGVVKVGAVYGVNDIKDVVKHKQWALTAAVPVGAAGKVQASFVRRKSEVDAGSDARVSQWGIGYEHALSKRTALYTAYADINNKGAADDGVYSASIGDATGTTEGAYQRGFTVGVRHSF
ncbi:porin [Azoarcus olearius]|uniref:Outer membrane porin protein n=1 Tax=Azoarcus sp. (strain BH72) TaxID=418699 RepID=A1KAQ0_AZOSB|nr:porin [Azoarcus olearius]CAL95906.1 outer membrane porin protein precursor [Azoarcus olearius]